MKTILVIEDTAGIRDMVREYLSEHGFRVIVANNGQEGLYEARYQKPDLVILDVMMPIMDGMEFLRQFRVADRTPVIMLTAKDQEVDKVLGLEFGADDYITKPFSMAELLARVRAVLRRVGEATPTTVIRHGELGLDAAARSFTVQGRRVDLTRSEFELMHLLMLHPQRVFTRLDLLEHLQEDAVGSERTIDVHIRNVRAKIERDPKQPRLIETVFGVGYRLDPEGR